MSDVVNGLYVKDLEVYSQDELIAVLEIFEGAFSVKLDHGLVTGDELRIIADSLDYANEHLCDRIGEKELKLKKD